MFWSVSPLRVQRWRLPLLLATGLLLPADLTEAASDIAVIAHSAVPQDNLSLANIRKMLFGERQFWSPDLRVTLVMHGPGAREREIILQKIYQMNEFQFQQYWVAKVFRGEVLEGPRFVRSGSEALQLVRSIPGCIAFVEAASVPDGVKILKVNGRLPGESGYALR